MFLCKDRAESPIPARAAFDDIVASGKTIVAIILGAIIILERERP
jgi:hypothetical protein